MVPRIRTHAGGKWDVLGCCTCLEILGGVFLAAVVSLLLYQVSRQQYMSISQQDFSLTMIPGSWIIKYFQGINRTRWFGPFVCGDKYVFGVQIIVCCIWNTSMHTGMDSLIIPFVNEPRLIKICGAPQELITKVQHHNEHFLREYGHNEMNKARGETQRTISSLSAVYFSLLMYDQRLQI